MTDDSKPINGSQLVFADKVPSDSVFSAGGEEVLKIDHEGNIFWRGREVESDDDFKAAMLDLVDMFKGVY